MVQAIALPGSRPS